MNTRLLLATVFVVAVAVIGYAVLTAPSTVPVTTTAPTTGAAPVASPSSPQPSSASPSQSGSASPSPTPGSTASGYTLAQVAQHNSASSCWAAINGNVYDLTNWINQHPGGPEHILAICGTDGSAAFNTQHGGQSRPAQELAQFLIGALNP